MSTVPATLAPGGEVKEHTDWDYDNDSGKRTMNWAFTWNNYTEENCAAIANWCSTMPDMRCVVYGREIAPTTKTPHLQGLFIFHKLKSFSQVKKMLPQQIRFSQMRKPLEANLIYCRKDGKVTEHGDVPLSQKEKGEKGKEFISLTGHVWSHLIEDIEKGMSYAEAAKKYPDMHGMYPKGFREKFDLFTPKPQFDIRKKYQTLFAWQSELLSLMDTVPDSRCVYWVWSESGAVGKSDALKHLVSVKEFQPLQNAPTRDLACAWRGGSVVFDYSRDEQQQGLINYTILEHIKNRLVFSAKYESSTKMSKDFRDVHVVCFSNNPPDVTKLSKDRWRIFKIEDTENKPWRAQMIVGDACV